MLSTTPRTPTSQVYTGPQDMVNRLRQRDLVPRSFFDSFFRGAASALDLSGVMFVRYEPSGPAADARSLQSDWQAVGDDIRAAFEQIDRTLSKEVLSRIEFERSRLELERSRAQLKRSEVEFARLTADRTGPF